MYITSSIGEICKKLRDLTLALSKQADGVIDAKQKIVPPFFADEISVNKVYTYLKETELILYSNVSLQLYQFRSRHLQLFSKIDVIENGKYKSLGNIADMFMVVERACMEIQQRIHAQMTALEKKNYESFFTDWYAQQEINARLDKFFEAQAQVLPNSQTLMPFAPQKKEVKLVLKKHGFARAAAMIALALTLFIQSILPSAQASSKPIEPVRFTIPNITTQSNVVPKQTIVQKIVNVIDCANFTKYWEGFRSVVYTDSLGYLTIGYGTCIDKRIKPDAPQLVSKFGLDYSRIIAKNQRVSTQTAQKMLESEISVARAYAPKAVKTFETLPEYAQLCVVDMIYNLGLNNFLKFKKMIAALERHDYASAAYEMRDSKWFNQTKQRAQHHVGVMYDLAKAQLSQQDRMAA